MNPGRKFKRNHQAKSSHRQRSIDPYSPESLHQRMMDGIINGYAVVDDDTTASVFQGSQQQDPETIMAGLITKYGHLDRLVLRDPLTGNITTHRVRSITKTAPLQTTPEEGIRS